MLGLGYSIYSFASGLSDGGILGVYAGTGEAEAGEVVRIVCDELRALSVRVGADEVQRARAQLKASTLMARESTAARRSEERRVGTEGARPCSSRWSPFH